LDQASLQDVLKGYEQLNYLLYILGEAAIKYGVSLVDEVDLLTEFREQLKKK
jgi:hypothetical protein